ncbi:MAG TPA: alpha/beta fold hydrolase [Patescibacteria group bacterium]|nr:alpha/beta fold hydrolase [Patescibacteria group bacterium]
MDQQIENIPVQEKQASELSKNSQKKINIFVVIFDFLHALFFGFAFLGNSRNRKIVSILLLCLLFILIGIVVYSFIFGSSNTPKKLSETVQNTVIVSPTPFPFIELTVPYLREREYKSSLGEREVYANNSNYTSYLTSYDSDGLKVNALLTIPTGERPEKGFPAIIFVHGYIPPTQYQTTENYASYVDYLARNGFVVLKIDLRGHGDSEGEPGGGYFGSDYIVDTLNARAALQGSDFVNPDAIGLWGHSMAGNILLRSMVSQPDIPAIVIWAGAVYTYMDMQTYRINDNSYRPPTTVTTTQRKRQALMQRYGSPSATSEFWKQVIPTNYLSDIKGAIQLNHAVNDDVVDIRYSRDLTELLDKTSVPHELWEYATGGHNIDGASFVQAMNHTVEFFTKYLK